MTNNTTKTARKYIISGGHGELLMATSATRGATWTADATHAMAFSSRANAERCIKAESLTGASVAVAS